MPPVPNFCKDGTIIPGGKDECGCQMPPRCERSTTNWKTYTNIKYGYLVKYPPFFIPEERTSDIFLSKTNFENSSKPMKDRLLFSIEVRKTTLDKEIEYQKWTVEGHVPAILKNETEITKDGYKGIKLAYESESVGPGSISPFICIIINNGTYSYTLHFSDTSFVDLVLSTFRFLPSTGPSATSSGPSGSGQRE